MPPSEPETLDQFRALRTKLEDSTRLLAILPSIAASWRGALVAAERLAPRFNPGASGRRVMVFGGVIPAHDTPASLIPQSSEHPKRSLATLVSP